MSDSTPTEAGADACDDYQKMYDCYKDCCDLDGTEETLKSCAGWGVGVYVGGEAAAAAAAAAGLT